MTEGQEQDQEPNAAAMAMFDAKLNAISKQQKQHIGRRNMWLAHHWPDEYGERCVHVGGRPVCRRCLSLYPLGLLIAILTAAGTKIWPDSLDPWMIYALSIPATVAYCGEALGVLRYNAKVQVITTLITALAFGKALGYEFQQRWSWEFWGPVIIFGAIWFLATEAGKNRK